jgi:hypothetical protein
LFERRDATDADVGLEVAGLENGACDSVDYCYPLVRAALNAASNALRYRRVQRLRLRGSPATIGLGTDRTGVFRIDVHFFPPPSSIGESSGFLSRARFLLDPR